MANTSLPLSEVAISNFGAHTLDERPITSLDDTSKYARFCAAEFGYTRDELLRSYPWCFAREFKILAPESTSPPFGWKYAFAVPVTWVRILPLTCNGMWNGRTFPYEKVGNTIYTDQGPSLKARGIRRVTVPGEFDPLFARALGQLLALRAAENITGKAGYVVKAQSFFNDAIQTATLTDSLERGTPETVENDAGNQDVLAVRGIC